jgi:hypothetical protein
VYNITNDPYRGFSSLSSDDNLRKQTPQLAFHPSLPLGGSYRFRLKVTDFCGTYNKNVTFNIICLSPPSVTIAEVTNSVRLYDQDFYGSPHPLSQVVLRADVDSKLPVTYSWSFLAQPNPWYTRDQYEAPEILPNSMSRHMIFNPHYSGLYTVQVAVHDGCTVVYQTYNVTVTCSLCAFEPVFRNGPDNLLFRRDSAAGPQNGTFTTSTVRLDNLFDAHDANMDSNNRPRFVPALITNAAHNFSQIGTDPSDVSYNFIAVEGTNVTYINVTTVSKEIGTATFDSSTPLYRDVAAPSVDPNIEPQERYLRATLYERNDTTEVRTTTWVINSTLVTPNKYSCQINITNSNPIFNPNWVISAAPQAPYGPDACVGDYHIQLTVADDCLDHNRTVQKQFAIACTAPVAVLQCHSAELNYSRATQSFGQLTLDQRNSFDPLFSTPGLSGGQVLESWSFWGTDSNICGPNAVPCMLGTEKLSGDSWTPFIWTVPAYVKSGISTIKLRLWNGCKESWDSTVVRFGCDLGLTITSKASPDHSNYQVTHDYSTGQNTYASATVTDIAFVGNASIVDVAPIYNWTLVAYPDTLASLPPYNSTRQTAVGTALPLPFLPSLLDSNTNHASLNKLYPGDYSLIFNVEECNVSSDTVKVTVNCNNVLTLDGAYPTSFTQVYGSSFNLNASVLSSIGTENTGLYTRYWVRDTMDAAGMLLSIPYTTYSTSFGTANRQVLSIDTSNALTLPLGSKSLPDAFTITYHAYTYDNVCKWFHQTYTVTLNCPVRNGTLTSVQEINPRNFTSGSYMFLKTYTLTATFDGPLVSINNAYYSWYYVSGPTNAQYTVGNYYNTSRSITINPTAPGQYVFRPFYSDGCGEPYKGADQIFTIDCPQLTFTATATDQVVTFNDQNNIGFRLTSWTADAGYTEDGFTRLGWFVTKAPADSIYAPVDKYTYGSKVTITNSTVGPINGFTNFTLTTVISNYTYHYSSYVKLDMFTTGNDDFEYSTSVPTWLRPDKGGDYEVTFKYSLGQCNYSVPVSTKVTCPTPPDLSSIESFQTVTVDRAVSPVYILDASTVPGKSANGDPLVFQWKLVWPTPDNSTNTDVYPNVSYVVPGFLTSAKEPIAQFQPQDAGINYIFDLYVSDGCTVVTKRITVASKCSVELSNENTNIVATYDGSVPIHMMGVAYDYHTEIGEKLPYPNCQNYQWTYVSYSATLPDELLSSGSTPFTKTAGFGGVIAAIIVVGVAVPVVLYLYFTKKACFKASDPRV